MDFFFLLFSQEKGKKWFESLKRMNQSVCIEKNYRKKNKEWNLQKLKQALKSAKQVEAVKAVRECCFFGQVIFVTLSTKSDISYYHDAQKLNLIVAEKCFYFSQFLLFFPKSKCVEKQRTRRFQRGVNREKK